MGDFISIKDSLLNFTGGNNTLKKHLNKKSIENYLFTFDLMEYDFKTVYKTFDVSYFTKDKNLLINNLVDLNELKNYESIEKSTDQLILILIKKFKNSSPILKIIQKQQIFSLF